MRINCIFNHNAVESQDGYQISLLTYIFVLVCVWTDRVGCPKEKVSELCFLTSLWHFPLVKSLLLPHAFSACNYSAFSVTFI